MLSLYVGFVLLLLLLLPSWPASSILLSRCSLNRSALLSFTHLVELEDYVQDLQAINHNYVLMGMDLKGDEEYAGMG